MRTMLKASMDVTASNKAIQNGSLPALIKETLERLKPEASYFLTYQGKRTCIMIFDMKNASEMPSIAEPFFIQMNAEVELTPVMNADDLRQGLAAWMEAQDRMGVSVN